MRRPRSHRQTSIVGHPVTPLHCQALVPALLLLIPLGLSMAYALQSHLHLYRARAVGRAICPRFQARVAVMAICPRSQAHAAATATSHLSPAHVVGSSRRHRCQGAAP